MGINFINTNNRQQKENLRLERDCTITICSTKDSTKNASIYISNKDKKNVELPKAQFNLLLALASANDCDTDDDIDVLTSRDLFHAYERYNTPSDIFRELGVIDFKYNQKAMSAEIKTKTGEVLKVNLKSDNSSKKTTKNKVPAYIKKPEKKQAKQEKIKVINWNEDTPPNYTEWKKLKSYEEFLNVLGKRESNNKYNIKNSIGYLGRFQMGELALIDAKFYKKDNTNQNDWKGSWTAKAKKYNVTSAETFLKNPKAQDAAYESYLKQQWKYIKNFNFEKAINTKINDNLVTKSGLLASAHLVGIGNVKKYLESNGRNIPKDAYGTSLEEYLTKFGGIDISHITD